MGRGCPTCFVGSTWGFPRSTQYPAAGLALCAGRTQRAAAVDSASWVMGEAAPSLQTWLDPWRRVPARSHPLSPAACRGDAALAGWARGSLRHTLTHTHTHTYTQAHTHIHTRTHTHRHAHTHIHITRTHTYIHTYIHSQAPQEPHASIPCNIPGRHRRSRVSPCQLAGQRLPKPILPLASCFCSPDSSSAASRTICWIRPFFDLGTWKL